MRHLCLPLLLLIASGVSTQTADEVRDVVGYQGDDVLLPCNCADRDLKEGFKWQTENPPSLIFKVKPTEEINWGNYKTRVEIFVNESSNDCSILLKNITEDDNKTYTCSFKNGVCKFHTVNLKVIQRPATRSTATTSTATTSTVPPDIPRVVTSPRQYLTIIPALVLLLMGCIVGFIGITYLKQERCWGAPNKKEKLLSSEDV